MIGIKIRIAAGRKDWRRLAEDRQVSLAAARGELDALRQQVELLRGSGAQLRKELSYERDRADGALKLLQEERESWRAERADIARRVQAREEEMVRTGVAAAQRAATAEGEREREQAAGAAEDALADLRRERETHRRAEEALRERLRVAELRVFRAGQVLMRPGAAGAAIDEARSILDGDQDEVPQTGEAVHV